MSPSTKLDTLFVPHKYLQHELNVPISKDFLLKHMKLHTEESDGITKIGVSYLLPKILRKCNGEH
jgi:hypothetical protein